MLRSEFDEYVRRFNEQDATAFDDYLWSDVVVLNGNLEIPGVEAMKSHYTDHIWPHFKETLNVLRFVSDDQTAAVQLWTNFTALHAADSIFGAVQAGDQFDYRGVIMYYLRDNKFTSIRVAYNSFTSTRADGTVTELGIVH